MTFSARTDVGKVRSQNEDNFLVDRKLRLYVVCDGMGGHLSGEVASATAVNVVRETLLKRREILEGFAHEDGRFDETDVLALVEDAVHVANQRIFERGHNNPAQRGMGTTLSLLLFARDTGFIAHVGDTRIYRKRGDQLVQLTEDHSLVNEMARSMQVSADQFDDRLKNAITRAVGVHGVVEVDAFTVGLSPGDRFLLCSDGLHGLVDDPALNLHLDGDDLSEIAGGLVDMANAAGGRDNITAVIVEVQGAITEVDEYERLGFIDTARSAPLFAGMSEAALARVVDAMVKRELAPDELLLDQGKSHDTLTLVVVGALRANRNGQPVARLGPSKLFGEDALLRETASPCAIRAAEEGPTTVLQLSAAAFARLVDESPAVALRLSLALNEALTQRLHDANAQAPDFRHLYRDCVHRSARLMEPHPTVGRLKADTLTAMPRPKAQPRPRSAASVSRFTADTLPATRPIDPRHPTDLPVGAAPTIPPPLPRSEGGNGRAFGPPPLPAEPVEKD